MERSIVKCVVLALVVGMVTVAEAAIFDGNPANGDLTEWGASINGAGALELNNSVLDWGTFEHTPWLDDYNPVTKRAGFRGGILYYQWEDTDDTASSSFPLGPNQGGQNYDSEFLGVFGDGTNLYIAIVTGQRPDNGTKCFAPGDIRIIDKDGRTYGIEAGGGVGDTSRTDGQITSSDPGTTYNLTKWGYTDTSNPLKSTPTQQNAGSVWADVPWYTDPIQNPYTDTQIWQINGVDPGSTRIGQADNYFSYASALQQHAFIEVAVPLSLFDTDLATVAWSPSCGNDLLDLEVDLSTPEPASFIVWSLLAALGMIFLGWRRLPERSLCSAPVPASRGPVA